MKKESHIEFIKHICAGKSQSEAYMLTNANKSITYSTAKVQGSKLAKKYATEITAEKERLRKLSSESADSVILSIATSEIMGKSERMKILTAIARGEKKVPQVIVVNGSLDVVESTPNYSDIRAAISELNKMDGSYAPSKVDHAVNGIKQIIIEPASANRDK
jgi:hypothetical protein